MRVVEFTKITSVEVLGHYRLRLGFSDGISRDVDLVGELRGPVFEALADRFRRARDGCSNPAFGRKGRCVTSGPICTSQAAVHAL
jgi:hypothetical protein